MNDCLRIYLARHGQTDWNAAGRLQGWTDTDLNETGKAQALELASKLGAIDLDAIYCSALKRSRQTAELVSNGVSIVSLPDLNERRLGSYEGKCLDLEELDLVEVFRGRCLDPEDTLDGGESYVQHSARIQKALAYVRSRHRSGHILIIAHGGTNQLILKELLNLPKSELGSLHQENTDIFVIEISASSPVKFWRSLEDFRG